MPGRVSTETRPCSSIGGFMKLPRQSAMAALATLLIAILVVPLFGGGDPVSSEGQEHQALEDRLTPMELLTREYELFEARTLPRVEKHIAACMKRRGFTYVAQPDSPTSPQDESLREREFAEQYGYGIVARILEPTMFELTREVDPNATIRGRLSPSRQTEFDRALTGNQTDAVPVLDRRGHEIAAFFPRSCVTRAHARYFGAQRPLLRATAKLNRLLPELRRRIQYDPLVQRARIAWSTCMLRKGYHFHSPDEILEFVARHARANGQLADLLALQQGEVRLALSDRDCAGEVGLGDTVYLATSRHETLFIEAHPRITWLVWGSYAARLSRAAPGA